MFPSEGGNSVTLHHKSPRCLLPDGHLSVLQNSVLQCLSFLLHFQEGGWGLHRLWKVSFAACSREWSHLIRIKQCVQEGSPAVALALYVL